METHQKVNAGHLKRNAYVYIRQSTPRQVLENSESTRRQYALRQRALALGWASEQILVIDTDLGQSGASAADREGFQHLVSEVGIGRAGIVLGLEVSRLARNSTDWHRLLEICALTDTLILDEDGIYDPSHFNDRLLLGLKGTMSEAELHVMQARMRGGLLNKARRGELALPLPIGLVYDTEGQVILDPDRQVQQSIRLLFATFRRTGTACATVRSFREQGLLFPRRPRGGPGKGQLLWVELTHSHVIQILRNPRYAGAFVYGRTRTRRKLDGPGRSTVVRRPREEWHTLLLDAHPGYIDWEDYEENLRRLRENAQAYGGERRSPPREGPALLQGLVLCGLCGKAMTVGYRVRQERLIPEYLCQQDGIARAEPICQRICGAGIDEAIGQLLMEVVTPVALEVTLAVQGEIQSRWQEADRLRQSQVDRARYEAHLAQRRYLQIDPDNRLVADILEADWNSKLRALQEAQQTYERDRQADRAALGEEQQARILALAADFPRLWQDPKLPDRERKRMVRLLLEDVTLVKREVITMHVRFKGGATKTIQLPIPPRAWEKFRTHPDVVREIDKLLDDYTDQKIADILNKQGRFRPGKAPRFHRGIIRRIRTDYGLKSRYERLREAGMLTQKELAQLLDISPQTVCRWWKHGILRRHAFNDKAEHLYENPGSAALTKKPGVKLAERKLELDNKRLEEVQYEA